jgi:hypothetical protein
LVWLELRFGIYYLQLILLRLLVGIYHSITVVYTVRVCRRCCWNVERPGLWEPGLFAFHLIKA